MRVQRGRASWPTHPQVRVRLGHPRTQWTRAEKCKPFRSTATAVPGTGMFAHSAGRSGRIRFTSPRRSRLLLLRLLPLSRPLPPPLSPPPSSVTGFVEGGPRLPAPSRDHLSPSASAYGPHLVEPSTKFSLAASAACHRRRDKHKHSMLSYG